jgi:hypothetical protein
MLLIITECEAELHNVPKTVISPPRNKQSLLEYHYSYLAPERGARRAPRSGTGFSGALHR